MLTATTNKITSETTLVIFAIEAVLGLAGIVVFDMMMTAQEVSAAQSITTLQNNNNDNYEIYENPKLKIKLQYPSDWRNFESDGPALSNLKGIVTFEPLQEKGQEETIEQEVPIVSIIAEDLPSNNITIDQFIKIQHDNFRQLFSDFNFRLENKTAVIIGDDRAEKFEYTIVDPYSDRIRNGMVTWIIRGDTVYMVSYVGEQAQYSKYLPIVEKLIDSIEFTNDKG